MFRMTATVLALLSVLVFIAASAVVGLAQSGPVILSVQTADQTRAKSYNRTQLESLGLIEITTITPWTDGDMRFEGVLARNVLADFGQSGRRIIAVALNDYQVEIPVRDLQRYDVILATRLNGQPMSVRERGPIWVIYPWSDDPALQNEVFYARSIWQLRSIQVQAN